MANGPMSLPVVRGWGETSRRDGWWVQPLVVFLGLSAFIVYSTWAAFQGDYYWDKTGVNHYLSPMYSPELLGPSPHSWFGPKPDWWPGFLPFSAALLILWMPGGFRLTCYYYRGAYYKAFWADPPSCAVGEPRKSYWGENRWPLLIQNIHRYFLYIALVFIALLTYDAINAMRFTDLATGTTSFGIGVGTLVMIVNVILLGGYTLGCHSFRHLIGGKLSELSKAKVRQPLYQCSSCLNRGHMLWAWTSLVWVAFTDIYIRLCSMGIWTDWRII